LYDLNDVPPRLRGSMRELFGTDHEVRNVVLRIHCACRILRSRNALLIGPLPPAVPRRCIRRMRTCRSESAVVLHIHVAAHHFSARRRSSSAVTTFTSSTHARLSRPLEESCVFLQMWRNSPWATLPNRMAAFAWLIARWLQPCVVRVAIYLLSRHPGSGARGLARLRQFTLATLFFQGLKAFQFQGQSCTDSRTGKHHASANNL